MVVLAACFAIIPLAREARAQRMEPVISTSSAPTDSSPPLSTATARIVLGSAIGSASFVLAFFAFGQAQGNHWPVMVGAPLVGSALGAAMPPSRAGCYYGDRFLRGLVGSALGTAASVALATGAAKDARDAGAVAAVVTIMIAPAVGATFSMGRCRH